MWQPEGVEGPSVVVDHSCFTWGDRGWRGFALASAVMYELHVGTFSAEGTFDSAIAHLGHLVDLGVNAIELMPVAEASGGRGWGYDGVGLWAPHHAYGGPGGLKRLVNACHARGLAVVLDVVYNHLGWAGNYLPEFGPYFADAYRTPWGAAMNMDGHESYGVRDFVTSNALMWLRDYHMDGLRLDAVHAIHDQSAMHVLEELSAALGGLSAELGRVLWLIAEDDRNDPRLVTPRPDRGYERLGRPVVRGGPRAGPDGRAQLAGWRHPAGALLGPGRGSLTTRPGWPAALADKVVAYSGV